MKRLLRKLIRKLRVPVDINFILATLFINAFGLIMIYSASYSYAKSAYNLEPAHFFTSQLVYVVIGFVLLIAVSLIKPDFFKKFWKISLVFIFILIFAVRMPVIGHQSHGAYRWVGYGALKLQVAEPIKVLTIVSLAGVISKYDIRKPKVFLLIAGVTVLAAMLLAFLTNNASTAIIVFLMVFFVMMVMHPKTRYFILAMVLVLALAALAVFLIENSEYKPENGENFRITRIRAWLHPTDPNFASDMAYQPTQALYAIASGGFFGKGLGQSLIKFKLPEPHNDYILAVIFEELGIFGVLILTLLFSYLLFRIYRVFLESKDRFSRVLTLGVFFHLALQIVLNYMITLGLFPTSGVTLTFISAGGSAAMFTLIELGFVVGVMRENAERRIYEEARSEIEDDDPYYKKLKEEGVRPLRGRKTRTNE